jgi:hypothetical protein
MSSNPPSSPRGGRPSSKLVVHDIHLEPEVSEDGTRRVSARVQCERARGEVLVDTCARCPRFVRIETHEAGYTLLCHAKDAPPASTGTSEEEE